jgi:hypothetical protein
MMLHQDGSRFAWLAGTPELDLIVTLDDARFLVQRLVEGRGFARSRGKWGHRGIQVLRMMTKE